MSGCLFVLLLPPPGMYAPGTGMPFCLSCPAGTYVAATECVPCPALTFGGSSGLSSASCSGPCVAAVGYYCGAGAVSPTGTICPQGRYSLGGPYSTDCSNCPSGRYGNASGLQSPLCSGACPPGQYGDMQAAAACSDCPPGRFGNTTGQTAATCTAACPPGYACRGGVVDPRVNPCPAGTFRQGAVRPSLICV